MTKRETVSQKRRADGRPAELTERRALSTSEACRRLGCSRTALQSSGMVPFKIGRVLRWPLKQIEALEAGELGPEGRSIPPPPTAPRFPGSMEVRGFTGGKGRR